MRAKRFPSFDGYRGQLCAHFRVTTFRFGNGAGNKRVIFTIVSVPIYYRRRGMRARHVEQPPPLDHFQLAIIQYRAQTSNNRPRQSSYRHHVYYRNVIKCPLPSALLLLLQFSRFSPTTRIDRRRRNIPMIFISACRKSRAAELRGNVYKGYLSRVLLQPISFSQPSKRKRGREREIISLPFRPSYIVPLARYSSQHSGGRGSIDSARTYK